MKFSRAVAAGLVGLLACGLCARAAYDEGYYLFLNNYPDELGADKATQGLAHDSNHWFLATMDGIEKIPVEQDLVEENHVAFAGVDDVPCPDGGTYIHMGDPDYYWYKDVGFVFGPLEDCSAGDDGCGEGYPSKAEAIAVFDAATMNYISHDYVATQQLYRAGWVAVYPVPFDGGSNIYLYSSASDNIDHLIRYRVNLERVRTDGELDLVFDATVPLYDATGTNRLTFGGHLQGGEFTPSGDLLYLVVGRQDDHTDYDGINVFETRTWRHLRRSCITGNMFSYTFYPGGSTEEEPEGLTIWDLDDGRAPGIRGQLHVLLLDNFEYPLDYYIKHYTSRMCVDGAAGNNANRGSQDEPLATVSNASLRAWDDMVIIVRSNTYPESDITFTQRVRVVSEGGTARIGSD